MATGSSGAGEERSTRTSSSVEDYLEAIYVLSRGKGHARVLEIASFLGIRPPSVTQMLKKLKDMGLVQYERYGMVVLTGLGEEKANRIAARHADLKVLLLALGLTEDVAEREACAMEHVLHEKTLAVLKRLGDFLSGAPEGLRCLRCLRIGKYLCLAEQAG